MTARTEIGELYAVFDVESVGLHGEAFYDDCAEPAVGTYEMYRAEGFSHEEAILQAIATALSIAIANMQTPAGEAVTLHLHQYEHVRALASFLAPVAYKAIANVRLAVSEEVTSSDQMNQGG